MPNPVRFMVEVAKRFRDAVLADTDFQAWATDTLPAIVIKWKVIGDVLGSRFSDSSPFRKHMVF